MGQHETIPHLNGNPLNLMYKGVFSTRIKGRNNSRYGHYLDKLYQIQFLGIGTHGAREDIGHYSAAVVKLTSLGGEMEKANVVRANEVVVSELITGGIVPVYSSVLEFLSYKLEDINYGEVGYDVGAVTGTRYGDIDLTFNVGSLDISHFVTDQYLNALHVDVNEAVVSTIGDFTTKVKGFSQLRTDLAKVSKYADIGGYEEFIRIRYGDVGGYEEFIKTIYGDILNLTPNYDLISQKEAEISDPVSSRKLQMMETLVAISSDNKGLKRFYLTSEDSLMNLVKSATYLDMLREAVGRATYEAIVGLGVSGHRKIEGVTYSDEHAVKHYQNLINDVITSHVSMGKHTAGIVNEIVEQVSRDVEGKLKVYTGPGQSWSDYVDRNQESLSRAVREAVEKQVQATGVKIVRPTFDFDHELASNESRRYKAVLDDLYMEFNKMVFDGNKEDSYELGETDVKLQNVLTEYVVGIKQSKAQIIEEVLATSPNFREVFVEGDLMSEGETPRIADIGEETHFDKLKETPSHVLEQEQFIKEGESKTQIVVSLDLEKVATAPMSIDTEVELERVKVRELEKGESLEVDLFSSDPVFVGDSREEEIHADLTLPEEDLTVLTDDYLLADMTSDEETLIFSPDEYLGADLTSEEDPVVPDAGVTILADLTSEQEEVIYSPDDTLIADLTSEDKENTYVIEDRVVATKVKIDKDGKLVKEYDLAVFGCAPPPDLHYKRRPPLEPDKIPDDPLFEWLCSEGYVCEDWLIVPLKDFNFENPDADGFFDPVTFKPYFPTGQVDELGDPYVLPPYSVLNEPISNGADVGGKDPMAIDPCNLYAFIEYLVKIYDAYKNRFQASAPTDTMSRVMNMLYNQVVTLIGQWSEEKSYTPDELWRIYRFIRWMALGLTNRFYRTKVKYTYGDFEEGFEVFPFNESIETEGPVRRFITGHGWVLDGKPPISGMENKARIGFDVPIKTNSSTISFEVGNSVPDRPNEMAPGGVLFLEDFEGESPRISGTGWVVDDWQSGRSLALEDPARARTYRTNTFNVPSNAISPYVRFNYGINTNMDCHLTLRRVGGAIVWQSYGITTYATAVLNGAPAGDYYFEITVPQGETNSLTNITFSAQQIQNEWIKAGFITEWVVVGDTIYEEENTTGTALVVNPQWMAESQYEFEAEFSTREDSTLYWAYDWLGFTFNYRDAMNYYLVGTWSDLDGNSYAGITKVRNGVGSINMALPNWRFTSDFRWRFNTWHRMKVSVNGNRFQVWVDGTKYLDVVDHEGWGYGTCGLAAWSNPMSTFRNFRYSGQPRIDLNVDNVTVGSSTISVPVEKPKYMISFSLDGEQRITNYSDENKRSFSFPILRGEHNAQWVFKKQGNEPSIPSDASFIDNILIRGTEIVGAEVEEEFIGCGGHMAVKLLIENLLEYYRRHHQGCKGERNIWIIE